MRRPVVFLHTGLCVVCGFLFCLLCRTGTAWAAPETVYTIDSSGSRMTVYAYRGGLFGRFGHDHTIAMQTFKGRVRITDGEFVPADMELVVETASLKTMDKISDADRIKIETTMHQEVLETVRFPEIRFQSITVVTDGRKTGERTVFIMGMLTLHGISRPTVIEATVTVTGIVLRAAGTFTLDQRDYGIKPVSVFGGAVKVKEELKLTFDIMARRGAG
ncbi:MAG: YceI family protein [candidate division Zixibacteria bacterium]|nr:YceI family protein [candidate division Zixibacteria bacterium]